MTRLFLLIVLLLLGACSARGPIGNPEFPYPTDNPGVGDLIHLPTGHHVAMNEMLAAIGSTRIVYVGETHDNPASHQLQLDVIKGMFEQNPQRIALGMEMFTPEQQPILDRWSAGELEEKEFLQQVGWFENWQMNFALYRPLLDYCRDKRIPVVALNAPKALVRKLGRTPLDELTPEERAGLPELDFSDPYQRAMTEGIYGGHSMGKAMSDGFIRVQTLWDETMAAHLVEYLMTAQGIDRQMVVVAGGNHVRYGFGIPRRAHRRLPLSYLLIGSQEIEVAKDLEVQRMDVELPQFPMRAWDYLKLTRYEKVASGVKLGIAIANDPGGVRVTKVMPESVADKTGIKQDDLLLQAAGTALADRFDLLYLLMNLQEGKSLELKVQRGEELLPLRAEF